MRVDAIKNGLVIDHITAGKAMEIFGYPEVSANPLIKWQAEYILDGGRTLDKPTHFEERKGSY